MDTLLTLMQLPAQIDPTPERPPGAGIFEQLLNWVLWGVILLGAFGLIASIGLVFFGVIDGRSSRGFQVFLIVCAALVLLGVVGRIIDLLIN